MGSPEAFTERGGCIVRAGKVGATDGADIGGSLAGIVPDPEGVELVPDGGSVVALWHWAFSLFCR
jgi:hypothetical protein